ncbi:hypothetical protein LQR31_01035 [Chromobacterium vaccinii]|uniref:pyocin knob domain-containing protein n=1 Tax=Chromobacterium vaccinii TaxID=1108595 RepID=UPI001E4003EB|nr:hypothetical protein [Chromobacterium vaccinii]MCD4483061.1 hypothetical protein [Chromobacterium vaccinii]
MQNQLRPINSSDGQFQDGNPYTGALGTVVTSEWLNGVQSAVQSTQRELLKLLQDSKQEVDSSRDDQLLQAVRSIAWGGNSKPTTLAGYGIADGTSKTDLQTAVNNLVAGAPGALNTLQELAAALGNDQNFAATITNQLANKADKATTLAGYGIGDATSKTDFQTAVNGPLMAFRGDMLEKKDLNTQRWNGWARQPFNDSAAPDQNYPPIRNAGALIVQHSDSMTFQQYQTYNPQDTRLYFRSRYGDIWGTWKQVWHDGNFNPDDKANKATTLAGYGITDAPTFEYVKRSRGKKLFTTDGTFTVPADVTTIYVSGTGGGGGGSGKATSSDPYGGAGGGGAEAVLAKEIAVKPGTSLTITIGKGGSGGAAGLAGVSGGATSFGDLLTLKGGGGATAAGNTPNSQGGIAGGNGGNAGGDYASSSVPGSGGGTIFGAGGSCGANGVKGGLYGGGGSGGGNSRFAPDGKGGDGANGFLLVEW